jgi:ATP-dependent RNA helicase DeaD
MSAIIFCNMCEDTATVASFLDRQGLDVQLISGELSQSRRSEVMKRVKSGDVRFLVATDVAARGIDISNLSHVINYALPSDASVYLHRTGRTGRIGKEGTAISLIGGADIATHKTLTNKHNLNFTVRELPDVDTCVQQRVERQAEQIRSAMSSMVFESYLPTVKALKARPDGDALLAAALRAFFQWDRQRRIDASGGGESSVRELLRQRNEKIGRRAERGGSGRKRNDRGRDRKGRNDRSDRRNDTRGSGGSRDKGPRNKRGGNKKGQGGSKPKHAAADLDALLSFDD